MRWQLKAWDELTRDELHAVLALRQAVFVVEQKCAYLDADGRDREALHLWAETDRARESLSGNEASGNEASPDVLAYLRVFPPSPDANEASLGRVLTARSVRRQGLGRVLVRRGIDVVRERFGPVAIRIGAQTYLERFYVELGFQPVGLEYVEDGIPHREMVRSCIEPLAR